MDENELIFRRVSTAGNECPLVDRKRAKIRGAFSYFVGCSFVANCAAVGTSVQCRTDSQTLNAVFISGPGLPLAHNGTLATRMRISTVHSRDEELELPETERAGHKSLAE